MNTNELETLVRGILAEKLGNQAGAAAPLEQPEATRALFDDVDSAVTAATKAYQRYLQSPLKTRSAIISALRKELAPHIEMLSQQAADETGMGNLGHKILKNQAALNNTPGIEDLTTSALTGDDGMVLFEYSPYGVIGSITPSTNPTATLINNSISMLAAGNAVYFSPHPGAKKICLKLIEMIEEIVFKASGIPNLIVTCKVPSFDATKQMMAHPGIPLLAVTGGPGIVDMAMRSGKKVIGAGAGNPPALVDETAEIVRAAQSIVDGSGFDYNLPCIAEKSVVVVESVADQLIEQMVDYGALLISAPDEIAKLRATCFNDKGVVNKDLVGKSPSAILRAADLYRPGKEPKLLILECAADDIFVLEEQLMPVLPIVRVADFDQALATALVAERGYHHTATMHSQNVSRLNKAAQMMQTSIFVKNGPSYAGIGVGGEGFNTFTIATPTGEGTTSARSFARYRRCVLNNGFSIR